MNETDTIKECYRQMYRGMIDKNRKLLSEILDDSFILMHMTGMKQSKEVFIRAIENGTLNYYSVEHEIIDVHKIGNRAELIGKSIVNAAVFGGGRHTWRLQLKLKLVYDGLWKITDCIASTY